MLRTAVALWVVLLLGTGTLLALVVGAQAGVRAVRGRRTVQRAPLPTTLLRQRQVLERPRLEQRSSA